MWEGENMLIIERSHIGKVRETNQDYVESFKSTDGKTLSLVCDGMGGHSAGDVASQMAVAHFGYEWTHTYSATDTPIQWIANQIKIENQRILDKANRFSDLAGMGTTMVGAAEIEKGWLVFNIGDSRGYVYSRSSLTQLTSDHSFVNELVRRGEISPEEARYHPKKNIVTRSLGVDDKAEADFFEVDTQVGDLLLLCTDGLTNMVSDAEIAEVLSYDQSLETKADTLLEKALAAGGTDNISFALLDANRKGGSTGE